MTLIYYIIIVNLINTKKGTKKKDMLLKDTILKDTILKDNPLRLRN